jgi:hypothetical protein
MPSNRTIDMKPETLAGWRIHSLDMRVRFDLLVRP